VGEGGVVPTDPADGSLQVQEALLLQGGNKQMRTNTPITGRLPSYPTTISKKKRKKKKV